MRSRRSWRNQEILWRHFFQPKEQPKKKGIKLPPRKPRKAARPKKPARPQATPDYNWCCGPECWPVEEWACFVCGKIWPAAL